MGDLDVISPDFTPRQAGEPVTIGGMAGRTRSYMLHMADATQRPAAGFALSSRCDLVVAVSRGPGAGSAPARTAVTDLLETAPVLAWIRSLLGKG